MTMIVLHSTGCARCAILEEKLAAKNIEFEINNDIDKMQELGIMSVPVLQIGVQLLPFKEANDWINDQEVAA